MPTCALLLIVRIVAQKFDDVGWSRINRATYLLRKREIMMKAAEMFNQCNALHRGLYGWLDDSLGQVRAPDPASPSRGYQWRPERLPACEYVAAFERAVAATRLKRPGWKRRLESFQIYFLGGTDYRRKLRYGSTLARDCIRHRIIFNRRTRISLQAARRDKGDTVGSHSDSIRDIRMDALYNRLGKRVRPVLSFL